MSQLLDPIRRADVEAVRDLLADNPQLANQPIAANPAEQTNAMQTPLHLAMPGDGRELRPSHVEIARLLIGAGAEIDAAGHGPNHGICSPLSLAAWGGHISLVALLLQHGAQANGLNETAPQHCPLQTAANHGHAEAARLLIDAGAQHGLAELILVGQLEPLNAFLDAHANALEQSIEDGSYPLHVAVSTPAATQLLSALLQRGADPNKADAQGRTPLLKAIECENAVAVAQLKTATTLRDIFTEIALGDEAAVAALINRDPRSSHETHPDGVTPLFHAAFSGSLPIATHLLDAGADPTPQSERFWACLSPLHLSLQRRHSAVTRLLLVRGADPDLYSSTSYRPTPLHSAARWGTLDDIQLLLDCGADLYGGQESPTQPDNGILAWMCRAGQTPVLELLLERGLDLEHPRCSLLLHTSCDSGHIELCQRLVGAGMRLDVIDEQNRTPRERALAQGHGDLVALLY